MMTLWILGGIALAAWGIHIWEKPYLTCTHCAGKKREYASDGVHYGKVECFWCYDSGERYRWELRWLTLF
jgi:hypothetical protein